jgi:CheY-like chemotaxis protein
MFDTLRVLYVEDDPSSRDVMSMIANNLMKVARLEVFEDSARFAERVNALNFTPSLILLDIHMKPIDGFAMLAHLRAHPRYQAIPSVALTASVMNEEIIKLRKAGFDGVIGKPVSLHTFPSYIERIMRGEKVWQTE